MKGFLIVCLLLVGTTCVSAGEPDHQKRKGRIVECMSLCDMVRCGGKYLKEVGCRVVDGTKTIVSAPFKTKICLPKPKRYFYQPPVFRPGRWVPLDIQEVKPLLPDIKSKKWQHPLHIEVEPFVEFTMASL